MKFISQEKEVIIPEGVTVQVKSRVVTVTGPRGVLVKNLSHVPMELILSGKKLTVKVELD
jgi:large subunit ribosomal protein L9e